MLITYLDSVEEHSNYISWLDSSTILATLRVASIPYFTVVDGPTLFRIAKGLIITQTSVKE